MIDYIMARILIDDNGCWVWQKAKLPKPYDYGQMKINKKQLRVHREIWKIFNGPIPEGLFVCHHCDTPSCCNPTHLFLGKPKDNTSDCIKKNRFCSGEKHRWSKLTEGDIIKIREDNRIHEDIAKEFDVQRRQVSRIKQGVRWNQSFQGDIELGFRKGEKNARAKITRNEVLKIREDSRTQAVISKEYGISQAAIALIKTRKRWAWL